MGMFLCAKERDTYTLRERFYSLSSISSFRRKEVVVILAFGSSFGK